MRTLGEFIEEAIAIVVGSLIFLPAVLLWPLSLVFDQRRYIIPKELHGEKLGLWRYFCVAHYSIREGGRCLNCGIPKSELVKR